jgi:glutamate synthase (NADPH) large chain
MPFSPRYQVDHDACGVGFIAQLGSIGSRELVERALVALTRLSHRGGVDADGLSGDGAGILAPISYEFVRACARDVGIDLPEAAGSFGLGMVFLPREKEAESKGSIEKLASDTGLRCLAGVTFPRTIRTSVHAPQLPFP